MIFYVIKKLSYCSDNNVFMSMMSIEYDSLGTSHTAPFSPFFKSQYKNFHINC